MGRNVLTGPGPISGVVGDDPRFLLAAIVDASDDAIISKDLDGIITSWNEGAVRIFGYEPDEVIGRSILTLIPPELHEEEARLIATLRRGGRVEHFKTKRIKKNGDLLDISLTISPVRDRTGRVVGISKIARDITAQLAMERALMESAKLAATGRMAATIVHEINNPLASVLNLVFLARLGCAPESAEYGYLSTAEKEIERVSQITRQTLGFFRETGAAGELMVRELVGHVLAVYKSKLMQSGISVECQYHDASAIVANEGELVQVFSNIVANSIDAMPLGGVLRVHSGEYVANGLAGVSVVIEDEGEGIDAGSLSSIFEPFYSTKGNRGNGIGLWVAKRLVEARGGRIEVKSSTKPGASGTSITVFLPLQRPEPPAGQLL